MPEGWQAFGAVVGEGEGLGRDVGLGPQVAVEVGR